VWTKPGADKKARAVTPGPGGASEDDANSVPLIDLVEVVAGLATPALHKNGRQDRAHLYVSLVRLLVLGCTYWFTSFTTPRHLTNTK